MSCNWRELSFGVEIEYSHITREESARVLQKYFHTQYLSLEDNYDTFVIVDSKRRKWKIVRDSSIGLEAPNCESLSYLTQYACELVTPILSYDDDILELQEIIRLIRKAGGKANDSTGFHVHVGAEQFDAQHLRFLCNIVYSKQQLLFRSVDIIEDRKRYCDLLSTSFITSLNTAKPKTIPQFADIWYAKSADSRTKKYNSTRYKILNLHNLLSGRQATVEYRLFNGTLHAGKIRSYIQLSLMITAKALNQSNARFKNNYSSNDKYHLRTWLLQLGFIGPEFKTARYHLLKMLSGNSAWANKGKEEEILF